MMVLWRLLFALFLSDFLLQNRWIIRNKQRLSGLASHCAIYLVVMLLCLVDVMSFKIFGYAVALALLHGVVDFAKHLSHPLFGRHLWLLFVLDQAVHCSTIVIAAGLISPADSAFIHQFRQSITPNQFYLYTSLFVINVFGGIYFTAAALQGVIDEEPELDEEQSRASIVIGMAERFLITVSVLVGRYELIAFLIAAKSLIRLPEIQISKSERGAVHFSNYFLVGTFLSYSWATSIAVVFKHMFL